MSSSLMRACLSMLSVRSRSGVGMVRKKSSLSRSKVRFLFLFSPSSAPPHCRPPSTALSCELHGGTHLAPVQLRRQNGVPPDGLEQASRSVTARMLSLSQSRF